MSVQAVACLLPGPLARLPCWSLSPCPTVPAFTPEPLAVNSRCALNRTQCRVLPAEFQGLASLWLFGSSHLQSVCCPVVPPRVSTPACVLRLCVSRGDPHAVGLSQVATFLPSHLPQDNIICKGILCLHLGAEHPYTRGTQ
eukprot:3749855-Amphidinium_carterae.1